MPNSFIGHLHSGNVLIDGNNVKLTDLPNRYIASVKTVNLMKVKIIWLIKSLLGLPFYYRSFVIEQRKIQVSWLFWFFEFDNFKLFLLMIKKECRDCWRVWSWTYFVWNGIWWAIDYSQLQKRFQWLFQQRNKTNPRFALEWRRFENRIAHYKRTFRKSVSIFCFFQYFFIWNFKKKYSFTGKKIL